MVGTYRYRIFFHYIYPKSKSLSSSLSHAKTKPNQQEIKRKNEGVRVKVTGQLTYIHTYIHTLGRYM